MTLDRHAAHFLLNSTQCQGRMLGSTERADPAIRSGIKFIDCLMPAPMSGEVHAARAACAELTEAAAAVRAPFAWEDGPLVAAMRRGDMMLIDELNLADDAVIERLNRRVRDAITQRALLHAPLGASQPSQRLTGHFELMTCRKGLALSRECVVATSSCIGQFTKLDIAATCRAVCWSRGGR